MKVYVIFTERFSGSWGCEPHTYEGLKIVDNEDKAKNMMKKMANDLCNNKKQACRYGLIWDPDGDVNLKVEYGEDNEIYVSGEDYEDEDYVMFSYEEHEVE